MYKMLEEARANGLLIDLRKEQGQKEKEALLNATLALVSLGAVKATEVVDKGNTVAVILLGKPELEEDWDKKLSNRYADNDNVVWNTRTYENRDADLQKLFVKLQISDFYEAYKERFIVENTMGSRIDTENAKKAEELFKSLLPVVEDGKLLLTEDSEGNSVWAYAMRNNAGGKFSYGIYRRNKEGKVGMSTIVSPSVVNAMGTKIGNTILDYEGTFNALNATQATQRLWLWNLCRKFEMQDKFDDYNPSDVNDILREWIIENVGKKIEVNKVHIEPVYIQKIKENVQIGIWVNDMETVFSKLDVEMKVSDWVREAMRERWIVPVKAGIKKDGTEAERAGYNPSNAAREAFDRKNKSERVYRIAFSDEEAKQLYEKYEAEKAKQVADKINNVAGGYKDEKISNTSGQQS